MRTVTQLPESRPFAKGERVYLPVGEGICAPEGSVWQDDGGEWVVVVHMPVVLGVSRESMWGAAVEVPADRLRRNRRGLRAQPYTETAGLMPPTLSLPVGDSDG